jgi:hypothetical protein
MPSQSRNQVSITIRLGAAQISALDAIRERDGGSRPGMVKQAVEVLLSEEGRAQLLRDALIDATAQALRALRQEAAAFLQEQVEASKASDASSRELHAQIIEEIGFLLAPVANKISAQSSGDISASATTPASSTSHVVLPPRGVKRP